MKMVWSRRARLMTGVGFGLAVLASSGVAAAQETAAPAQDSATQLDEVIVTTERRSQSIQDVAATVQAFTGEQLQQLGVNSDFRNLQYVVPGLQVTNQEGKLEVFLRGIGSTDSDFSSDPSIATHFNGVYLARPRGIGPLFFDAERVEVNKGPQGTLRGRNATGGSINIISNRPDFSDFYGHVQVGVGDYADRQAEAVVNLPITETLAVRGSVWTRRHDGLYSNAFPGAGDDFETPSSQDDIAGRLSIRWEPIEAFSANLLYSKAEVRSAGDPGAFSGRALSAGYDIDDLDDPWNQYFRKAGSYEGDLDTFLATLSYDFGGIGVEYNGSFNAVNAYNANASREWQLGQVYPGSDAEAAAVDPTWNDTFFQAEDSESIGHELRIFSQGDGPLQWTAGAFYFKEEYSYLSWDVGNGYCGDSDWFEAGTVSCWQNGLGGENRGDGSTVESLAFYADGSFALTDRFRIKAGIRQTTDEKRQNDSNAQYQFVFDESFLAAFGFNEFSDITIGNEGFRLAAPGGRSPSDPVVCGEFYSLGDLQTNGCEGGAFDRNVQGVQNLAYFMGGVQQWGLGDTWDDFFNACAAANACYAVIRSDLRPDGVQSSSNKDDYLNWRVGFEYDLTPDRLLYGTISTGTRAGGINRPVTLGDGSSLNSTWRPEDLTAYEIGSKNVFDVNGLRVRANAALFYYDYTDKVIQNLVDVPIFVPGNPSATTQQVVSDNAAAATVLGVELDGDVGLPANFNVGWAVTWLDGTFDETSILDPRSNRRGINVEGNRLPNTSEWNINLRVSQEIPLQWRSAQSFDWTVNLLYRSDYFLSPFNNKGYDVVGGVSQEVPLSAMPLPNNNGRLSAVGGPAGTNFYRDDVDGFVIVNANAGINFGDNGQYRFDAYVENATNQAFSGKGFINNSVNIRYLNAPRMYGVRLKAAF